MTDEQQPQQIRLTKSRRDAAIDFASLGLFIGMVYLVMNPDKYDQIVDAVNHRLGAIEHWMSIMQTKLSIRSLPETDE